MMLEVRDEQYMADVRSFAQQTGQLDDLCEKLDYLEVYACRVHDKRIDKTLTCCVLKQDSAPYSFTFTMFRKDLETGEYRYWFSGGLIYHGPHDGNGDGGAPTYSVSLTRRNGWSVHT